LNTEQLVWLSLASLRGVPVDIACTSTVDSRKLFQLVLLRFLDCVLCLLFGIKPNFSGNECFCSQL
jgi:hypothetical protein